MSKLPHVTAMAQTSEYLKPQFGHIIGSQAQISTRYLQALGRYTWDGQGGVEKL